MCLSTKVPWEGWGVIDVHGTVEFLNGSALASVGGTTGTQYGGTPGLLNIASGGDLQVNDLLSTLSRYRIEVAGLAQVASGARISADWGTSTTIQPSGRFEIQGDGGYYQGFPVPGQSPSTIVNYGVLAKTGGGSTSIVDATYVPAAPGMSRSTAARPSPSRASSCSPGRWLRDVLGHRCLRPPDDRDLRGQHEPRHRRDEREAPDTGCQRPDCRCPAAGADATAGDGRLQGDRQRGLWPMRTSWTPTRLSPATITLRFSQVGRDGDAPERGPGGAHQRRRGDDEDTRLHQRHHPARCAELRRPPMMSRSDAEHLRHGADDPDLAVAAAPQRTGRVVRPDRPGRPSRAGPRSSLASDGRPWAVAWSPPANDGGAATTAYRIYRDGTLVTSIVRYLGRHQGLRPRRAHRPVTAVNMTDASVAASATIKLDKLSKPREVKAVKGAAGGKAHRRREVEGAGGRRRLRHHQVQDRGLQGEREEGRQRRL